MFPGLYLDQIPSRSKNTDQETVRFGSSSLLCILCTKAVKFCRGLSNLLSQSRYYPKMTRFTPVLITSAIIHGCVIVEFSVRIKKTLK